MAGSIHPDNVLAALSKATGNQFEDFFKEFMSAIHGEGFIPLGGTHDGGADGFAGERLYNGAKTGSYYQASIQADYRGKIRGTVKLLRQAGSTLVLTEPSLDEVWTHIISTDTEFAAQFEPVEDKIDLTVASQAQRILIRSYFYTKLAPSGGSKKIKKGWSTYIDQFCIYRKLRTPDGKDSLREYLCRRYGLSFDDFDFLLKQVDADELEQVTKLVRPLKSKDVMARNDALTVLLVYARRRANREKYNENPYGYATWWLTQEARIQSVISDIVKAKGKCIIRPEFLMYYLSMLPKRHEVNELYKGTFPSLYGVKLGRRVRPELLADVLGRAKQYMSYDEARVSSELKAFADRLKADQAKAYHLKLHPGG